MSGDPDPGASSYVHGESEHWGQGISLHVQSDDDGRYRRIAGKCPRCGHDICKEIGGLPDGAFFAPDAAASSGVSEAPLTYLVTCNCVFGHQEAPEGVRGCGAQGCVVVTPGSPPLVTHAKGGVAGDWDKDEWIENAQQSRLPRMREYAGQWTAMLGVITGFVAVGTLFDFSKGDLDLSGGSWAAYVVFAALALAAAVAAVYFGSLAAGLRYLDHVPTDVAGRVKQVDDACADCMRGLRLSKGLALASVVLLAIAMGVRVSS